MLVIGIDIGTSGVKSTVFDEDVRIVAHAYREYDLICPGGDMYELDANVLLGKTMDVLRESIGKCDAKSIGAVCIASFGESFVCLDGSDRPLANTMIYMDQRGREECAELCSQITARTFFETSGQFVDPMFGLYKLRWLNKHRPEVIAETKKICFIADYIAHMLGADHVCDYSLAARSGMFDIKNKIWWGQGMDFAGIDEGILPKAIPGGGVAGTVRPAVATDLGLSSGVKLILAGHDQIAAAIGSGAQKTGDIANGMGTVDCMIALMHEGIDMDRMFQNNLPVVPYVEDGINATYAFNMSGGCTIKWFRDTFARELKGNAGSYDILNGEAPEKPTDLIVIPYFATGGTPYMDGNTPAMLSGLRLNTDRGELFRAFLEGGTYEMKLSLDALNDAGAQAERIFTVGGGSSSKLWMQIRADIFEKEIIIPENKEAGTLASAILCFTQLGYYGSVREAQDRIIRYEAAFYPNDENKGIYRKNYKRYQNIYQNLKEIYKNESK